MRKGFSLIFLLIPLLLQGQDKTTVAVIDFEGQGISDVEASILANRFRSELVNSNAFVVIERGQMESILKEVGFQQSGCTSSECLIEIGRILNVQRMIGGSIGKFGDVYTLDLRMIDIATSQIIETISEDHEGKMTDLLKVIKNVAFRFAARRVTADLRATKGSISVNSIPEGANILLNGKESGETPRKFENLEPGEYSIRITKEGFVDFETRVAVLGGKEADVSASLVGLFDLVIESAPSNAQVFLNDEAAGKTPYRAKHKAGAYSVKLKKNNYKDWDRRINLTKSGKLSARMELTEEYLARMRESRKKPPETKKEVKEDTAGGGGSSWLWIGLGIAAAGGAAVVLLGGGGGGDEPPVTNGGVDLPGPPPRPN